MVTVQRFAQEDAAHIDIIDRTNKKKQRHTNSRKSAKLEDIDQIYDQIKKVNRAPSGSIIRKTFHNLFDINAKGVLCTIRKALPIFKDSCHRSLLLLQQMIQKKKTSLERY